MSFWKEFKAFALRGNVIDLAVGIMIGTAFGKIVSSLVDSLFMPLLGALTAGVQINKLSITLIDATDDRPALILNYGQFLQASVDFVIIAFAIFLAIRFLQKWSVAGLPQSPKVSDEAKLLKEIRDLLQSQKDEPKK